MILARLAVFGAVLCSLWFNGSYAYAKASGHAHQFAMVAVALTIDLSKCSFLPSASHLWHHGQRFAPAVLVALWPLAFSYSLFAGYASVATNRSIATTEQQTQADARTRAQADYDQANATLATAKTSPLWTASAACTVPKTKLQRQFCASITPTRTAQQDAARKLDALPVVAPNPELSLLASITQLPLETLMLLIAFAPACILELVSSLGYYALNRRHLAKPQRTLADRFSRRWQGWRRPQHKSTPEAVSVATVDASMPVRSPAIVWPAIAAPN